MGAKVSAAVTTTQSPVLERRTDEVLIGDLEDLENLAQAAAATSSSPIRMAARPRSA